MSRQGPGNLAFPGILTLHLRRMAIPKRERVSISIGLRGPEVTRNACYFTKPGGNLLLGGKSNLQLLDNGRRWKPARGFDFRHRIRYTIGTPVGSGNQLPIGFGRNTNAWSSSLRSVMRNVVLVMLEHIFLPREVAYSFPHKIDLSLYFHGWKLSQETPISS